VFVGWAGRRVHSGPQAGAGFAGLLCRLAPGDLGFRLFRGAAQLQGQFEGLAMGTPPFGQAGRLSRFRG